MNSETALSAMVAHAECRKRKKRFKHKCKVMRVTIAIQVRKAMVAQNMALIQKNVENYDRAIARHVVDSGTGGNEALQALILSKAMVICFIEEKIRLHMEEVKRLMFLRITR
jgi:hypothetical protein